MTSLFFEDLKIGMEFRSSLSESFTLEMIEAFAALTGDRAHPPRVQGNFIVARSGGLLFECGHFNKTLFAQAAKNTRFLRALHIGECIYVVEKIIELENRRGSYGKVVLIRHTYNENHNLVLDTWQDYRVLKRPMTAL